MQKQPGNNQARKPQKTSSLARESIFTIFERHLVRIVVFGCVAAIAASVIFTLRQLTIPENTPPVQRAPQTTDGTAADAGKLHKTKTSLEGVDLFQTANPFSRLEP